MMKQKKTATITWITYPNFGTYLQAYALQRFVLSLGYDNAIIDDTPYTSITYKQSKNPIKSFLKRPFKFLSLLCDRRKSKMYSLYSDFAKKHLIIDHDSKDLVKLNKRYDLFICGSDQIWNPKTNYPGKEFYYASFSDKEKISYAPSIGISQVPEELKPIFKKRISGFKALSGREQPGCNLMSELSNLEVKKVVDPTLLLEKKQYLRLFPEPLNKKQGYVLVYLLSDNPKYEQVAKEYAHQKGLELKTFYLADKDFKQSSDGIDAGPIEFLQTIYGANCVITDSFHGSIFAYIFEVSFFTFKRFKNSSDSQNSRVENLLEMMKFSEYLIDEENLTCIFNLPDMDFALAKNNMSKYINESKAFLINSLK